MELDNVRRLTGANILWDRTGAAARLWFHTVPNWGDGLGLADWSEGAPGDLSGFPWIAWIVSSADSK